MKTFVFGIAVLAMLGTAPAGQYRIDLSTYFAGPAAEARSRATVAAEAKTFVASATPTTAEPLVRWLVKYDDLLESVQRHDIYVYLRAEENDADTADAKADDALGDLLDRLSDRVVRAARELGPARIDSLTRERNVAPYRYLLKTAAARAAHRLDAASERIVELTANPVIDAAANAYKALRKLPDPIVRHEDAYAALLISIAAARNGVARARGFDGAAQASYFDKSIPSGSVDRVLAALRTSTAYGRYRAVAARAPQPGFTPAAVDISAAIPIILAAEQSMGAEYRDAFAALLRGDSHRLDVCTAPECDDTGFSVGFAGAESGVYYGGYDGSVDAMRAVAHESAHAVHRQFMSSNQPIAAYNDGPAFMFESFAIFNELLFLDHLYEGAPTDARRAYYLNDFLKDATFQIFGSAEETELESAIYRGVDRGTLRTAGDFATLTRAILAHYDTTAARAPEGAAFWAERRLFFTDPLYDVNYLYAGLLALRYFADFERDPGTFSKQYVALLKNGFDDGPAALEKRFLNIDLSDEPGLVTNATVLIDARVARLSTLYASATPAP